MLPRDTVWSEAKSMLSVDAGTLMTEALKRFCLLC